MLEETIGKDYITAMKARDSVRSSTLNFLRAQLKNVRIDKRADALEDGDVIVVIKKQVKSRQDSIDQYLQGGRKDLADKEAAEMAILKTYLPEEVSVDALREIVEAVIRETGASSMKDMGQVMKAVIERTAGRADNKAVSALVKDKLGH